MRNLCVFRTYTYTRKNNQHPWNTTVWALHVPFQILWLAAEFLLSEQSNRLGNVRKWEVENFTFHFQIEAGNYLNIIQTKFPICF